MQLSNTEIQELTTIRKYLHAHPELSGKEEQTAAYIAEKVRVLEADELLENVGKTGLVATFQGEAGYPHLLFRGDIDALPITESNEFEHKSTQPGVSHKCGHDGHTTVLLGLARYLAQRRENKCTVSLLFQPSEENGAGARKVLADERFAKLKFDYVFAFHNLPGYPLGQILYKTGPFTAAVRSIIIKLKGKTGHAAEPENGTNPALAIADLLQFFAPLTNNHPERDDFAVVTPVHLIMGEKAYGISAGYGEIHLTIRTWTEANMDKLVEKIKEQCQSVAKQYDLKVAYDWADPFEANRNDPEAIELIEAAAKKHGYSRNVLEMPFRWGEDFGAISQLFNGAMFGIGSGEDCPPLHREDYDYPDEITEVGIKMFAEIIHQVEGKV